MPHRRTEAARTVVGYARVSCSSERGKRAHRYVARGIYVCERWQTFEGFIEDMGERPNAAHSIDRIDNDGSYTCGKCPQCVSRGAPANCRWATKREQARNQSRNVLITYRGRTQCVTAWAEETGVHARTLASRIDRGWSVEAALTTPLVLKTDPRTTPRQETP